MKRTFFILSCALFASFSCVRTTMEQAENVKPNVIYILTDDMGYGDLQSLNPDSKIPTPNMDKIVHEGVHFTDAHTNSSVCTPTRYGVLTGRYAWRTRLKEGVLQGYSPSLIEPGRETVATLMKKNGYITSCIGKWHLGLDWVPKNPDKEIKNIKWTETAQATDDDNVDYSQPVKGGPSDHGFDHSMIIPASLDMSPYCYLYNGKAVEPASDYTPGKSEKTDGRGVFWRAGKVSPSFDFHKVLPTLVDTACQYISRAAKGDAPFFMYLPLPAPHTPWVPTDKYDGKSDAGLYGDFVNMVDDQIGRVMSAVAAAGIDDNTLIIVTSDNGSHWKESDKAAHGHFANYIYRGQKADIYDAGHRVPFIARWKGVIQPGIKSDEIMCTTDLLATMAAMLSQPLNDNSAEDSYNMWPAFTGHQLDSLAREVIVHHSLNGSFAIRKGKWKYTTVLGSGGFTNPRMLQPEEGEAPGTLYDMEADPEETHNLYTDHPEIIAELSALLEKYKNHGYSRPME